MMRIPNKRVLQKGKRCYLCISHLSYPTLYIASTTLSSSSQAPPALLTYNRMISVLGAVQKYLSSQGSAQDNNIETDILIGDHDNHIS